MAPKGVEVILLGGLHVRLGDPRDNREEDLVMAFSDCGLVDITDHFLS